MAHRNPSWARDELILALDLYVRAGRRVLPASHPEVSELSQVLSSLPIHIDRPDARRFRNPNGLSMKLANFASIDPNSGTRGLQAAGHLDRAVWREFSGDVGRLRQVAQTIGSAYALAGPALADAEEQAFPEGVVIYRMHRFYERDRRLVRKAKAAAKARQGRLACEVCGFDFGQTYGSQAEGCIECHHAIPLSELGRKHVSRTRDLALLCANCHRAIHWTRPWLQVEELRAMMARRSLGS